MVRDYSKATGCPEAKQVAQAGSLRRLAVRVTSGQNYSKKPKRRRGTAKKCSKKRSAIFASTFAPFDFLI
jgi:hypothetical protein